MAFDLLLDRFGADGAAALCGLGLGVLFGAAAQRSRFCLRAAAVDFARGALGARVAVWLLAFGAAVLGVQSLIALDLLDVGASRQLAPVGSLSGAIIGGLVFGAGMVLARGCPARLLVLSATGNLRALLSGMIIAVVSQASLRGALAPLRDALAGWWTVQPASGTNALDYLGLSSSAGVWFALVCLAVAIVLALRAGIGARMMLAALAAGGVVVLAWWMTFSLSMRAFEPVQVESLTFTGPSADMLMAVLTRDPVIDFDIGLVPGVFIGAFLAALFGRELRLEGFHDAAGMRRYILGAALMGFGGMLAGGCAVGAGLTGGSVFSIPALVALTCMWIGAAAADALLDRDLAEGFFASRPATP